MSQIKEGSLLWEPDEQRKQQANITHYMKWLKQHKNIVFDDYHTLWKWSTDEVEIFWESLWEYFDIQADQPYQTILTTEEMPGAKWFPEATINYTEHIFKNRDPEQLAIIHKSETRATSDMTWEELYQQTAALQQTLKRIGVEKGDRVVAYVANIYETVVAYLATASLGAVWSSASPDFGTQSVIDRFSQIEPKVMIAVDGYSYNGKRFDRIPTVKQIQDHLPTLKATIMIPFLNESADEPVLKDMITWEDAINTETKKNLIYEYVAFNDPLWVLFSSGTTGKPKPIVQSQGGILLEHLKALTFHLDLNEKDHFFWFTTTGWMMWNFLVGGLLTGSTIVLYDGNPNFPDRKMLWKFIEEMKITNFGTSASFITDAMKNELSPKAEFNFSHLNSIGSTGSPLPPEGFSWCYNHVKEDLWIASASGGTDVCTAFILGVPILPVHAGELQCRGLGAKIESFTDDGVAKIGEVGELVLTKPLPSMPIYFWNDLDGSRLHESYFDMFPGVWRHGDYLEITDRKTCRIYGRSDATINRGGIRIGTSEIYRVINQVKEIANSLIIDIPDGKGDSTVPLFVVMQEDFSLTEGVKQLIRKQIREQCSPRHTPTDIYQVTDLPETLNGKKVEIPVKKILMGEPADHVINRDSLANPQALDYFIKRAMEDPINTKT